MSLRKKLQTKTQHFRQALSGPQLLAFLPALCLVAYWGLGEEGLILTALSIPFLWLLAGGLFFAERAGPPPDPSGSMDESHLLSALTQLFQAGQIGERSAVYVVALDDRSELKSKFSAVHLNEVSDILTARLKSVLRGDDCLAEYDSMQWCIALSAGPRLDLEAAIQHSNRIMAMLEDPIVIAGARYYISASIGFTMVTDFKTTNAREALEQAQSALEDAQLVGPGAVRVFAGTKNRQTASKLSGSGDISLLREGKIVAWFQPQVSTDTGEVKGFEALARWDHPTRGIQPPSAFLPVMEQEGRLEHLSDIMLQEALTALQLWNAEGLLNLTVGWNVSEHDLANPGFYDKVRWDIDRFDVMPEQLCIEILESVIAAGGDDVISRNVRKLSDLGCRIDLDDFGTGHASISSLRRLPVSRLKIDRSFVAKSDLDADQQKMVATILMMAERLGLDTLAEGVETLGEHAMVAQLGCSEVQGFGIAKPMPLEETVSWARQHHAKLLQTPSLPTVPRAKRP